MGGRSIHPPPPCELASRNRNTQRSMSGYRHGQHQGFSELLERTRCSYDKLLTRPACEMAFLRGRSRNGYHIGLCPAEPKLSNLNLPHRDSFLHHKSLLNPRQMVDALGGGCKAGLCKLLLRVVAVLLPHFFPCLRLLFRKVPKVTRLQVSPLRERFLCSATRLSLRRTSEPAA